MRTDADPRRVVVIDPATDNVTTIIGKASAAPGVGELRERMRHVFVTYRQYVLGCESAHEENDELQWDDDDYDQAVNVAMRVILGEGDS